MFLQILLFLFLSVCDANQPPLDALFCSDNQCSKDCVSWKASSGVCAPGTSSNSWVSSIMTYTTVESGDSAEWQWYGDNSSSHVCAASNLLLNCSAKLKIEQGCLAVTMCNGLVKGYYRLQGQPEAWLIAVIVVFGGVVPCVCICACCYFCCCRPGACCNQNANKSTPVTYNGDTVIAESRIPQGGGMMMNNQQMQQMQVVSSYYPPQNDGGQYMVNGQMMILGQPPQQQPMPLLNYYVGGGGNSVFYPQTYPQQQPYPINGQQQQQPYPINGGQQQQYYSSTTAVGGQIN